MSSTTKNCPHCNAPVEGPICEYCGTQVEPDLDFEQQKQALNSYHQMLGTAETPRRVTLLRSGFLPDDKRMLVEAGLRCVPMLGGGENVTVRGAASGRLSAIVLKLKLRPPDADVQRALAEFDTQLKEHERRETRNVLIGLGMVLSAALIVGCIAFGLYQVFF